MLFADKIRLLREEKQMLQRQLAYALEIDTPMYSRIERGDRPAKREQVIKLAKVFDANVDELLNLWMADKVYSILSDEKNADDILSIVAENMVEYKRLKS
jgi:transcriptional regulator with XRE-family HTH domain